MHGGARAPPPPPTPPPFVKQSVNLRCTKPGLLEVLRNPNNGYCFSPRTPVTPARGFTPYFCRASSSSCTIQPRLRPTPTPRLLIPHPRPTLAHYPVTVVANKTAARHDFYSFGHKKPRRWRLARCWGWLTISANFRPDNSALVPALCHPLAALLWLPVCPTSCEPRNLNDPEDDCSGVHFVGLSRLCFGQGKL